MNEIEKAKKFLAENASDWVVQGAQQLEANGLGEWVLDPEVRGVVGLLKPRTNDAWLIVYLNDEDFETSLDFDVLD